MFLENASRKGWIEVICGSMFSGKTEELIRRLKRARYANQKVEIFKPRIDVRYSSRSAANWPTAACGSSSQGWTWTTPANPSGRCQR